MGKYILIKLKKQKIILFYIYIIEITCVIKLTIYFHKSMNVYFILDHDVLIKITKASN